MVIYHSLLDRSPGYVGWPRWAFSVPYRTGSWIWTRPSRISPIHILGISSSNIPEVVLPAVTRQSSDMSSIDPSIQPLNRWKMAPRGAFEVAPSPGSGTVICLGCWQPKLRLILLSRRSVREPLTSNNQKKRRIFRCEIDLKCATTHRRRRPSHAYTQGTYYVWLITR